MKKIGKSHEIIQKIKEIQKTNHYPQLVIIDDLEILKLIYHHEIPIIYLLYSYEQSFHDETQNLLNSLFQQANECYEISNHTFESLQTKENHIGILAVIKIPQYQWQDLKDFIVVLDHLEIPGNIGTIYRTLDACGATGVIIVDPISKLNNPKLSASARGTNLIIPTICCSFQEAVDFLLNNQFTVYLGEPQLGKDYQSYNYSGKIAIVVGNERFGIQKEWYNFPHQKVFIPMVGNNNSINVGIAASILAYEAAMKRNNFH